MRLAAGTDADVAVGPDGEESPVQVADDGSLLFVASVPSCGYSVYELVSRATPPSGSELAVDESHLENSRLCVRWDETGLLTSVWDKSASREVLAPGSRGNVLQVFADYPNFYDAWDVDRFTLDHPVEVTTLDDLAVTERGPQRASVRLTRSFRFMQGLDGPRWLEWQEGLASGSRATSQPDLPSKHYVISQPGAARDSRLRNNQAMLSQSHVMGDLH